MAIKDMRIGLDLDGVVLYYEDALRTYAAKALGVSESSLRPATNYSFFKSGWFESEEQFKEIHAAAVTDGLYSRLKPFDGASKKLWALSDAGAHIHVITSRFVVNRQHAQVIADTAKSLDANKIPYKSIGFDAQKTNHLADIYVDDSPYNIKDLKAAGRHVLIFDALYNRDLSGARAKNWDEVYKYIVDNFATPEEKQQLR